MRRTWVLTALLVTLAVSQAARAHPGAGIVLDDEGQVYFTDTAKGIWRIDRAGQLRLASKLNWHWLAADREGRYADSRLPKWFSKVPVEDSRCILIGCSDFPATVGTDGNLYYANTLDEQPGVITRVLRDGKESVVAEMPKGPEGSYVTGLTSGPDGVLYMTVSTNLSEATSIWRIGSDGKPNPLAQVAIPDTIAADSFEWVQRTYCRDLAIDPKGSVFVAAVGIRSVLKIAPAGGISVVLTDKAPWAATGLAIYQDELYLLEYDHTGKERENWVPRVRKVAEDGVVSTLAEIGAGFRGPQSGLGCGAGVRRTSARTGCGF